MNDIQLWQVGEAEEDIVRFTTKFGEDANAWTYECPECKRTMPLPKSNRILTECTVVCDDCSKAITGRIDATMQQSPSYEVLDSHYWEQLYKGQPVR